MFASFNPFRCNINIYGEHARAQYTSNSLGDDSPIYSAETFTMTQFKVDGIAGAVESSLTYTDDRGINIVRKFMNDGYYRFKEWQKRDESGS